MSPFLVFRRSRIHERSCLAYKAFKQSAGEWVSLPADLRMPLHSQHKSIVTRILNCFHQTVRRPCGANQFPSHLFDCLVMMAVNRRGGLVRESGEHAALEQSDIMRMSLAGSALFVFDCPGHFAGDVLNQRAAA